MAMFRIVSPQNGHAFVPSAELVPAPASERDGGVGRIVTCPNPEIGGGEACATGAERLATAETVGLVAATAAMFDVRGKGGGAAAANASVEDAATGAMGPTG